MAKRSRFFAFRGFELPHNYSEWSLVNFCILEEWIRNNRDPLSLRVDQASKDEVTINILNPLGITIADECLIDDVWHCLLTEPDSAPVVVVSSDLMETACRACPDAIYFGRMDIAGFINSLDATAALIEKMDWAFLISASLENSQSPFFGWDGKDPCEAMELADVLAENEDQLEIPF